MARINQGIFNKIKKNYLEIEQDYHYVVNKYFPSGNWNCNYDFYSDFAYEAEWIYKKANDLLSEMEIVLKEVKFEMVNKKEGYLELFKKTQEIKNNILNIYRDIFNEISKNGMTEVELDTIKKMLIYRDL